MPNLLSCATQARDISLVNRIIDSAGTQNQRQMEIESRLGILLEQLRGSKGSLTGGGCGAPKPEVIGALHVLDEAVGHLSLIHI